MFLFINLETARTFPSGINLATFWAISSANPSKYVTGVVCQLFWEFLKQTFSYFSLRNSFGNSHRYSPYLWKFLLWKVPQQFRWEFLRQFFGHFFVFFFCDMTVPVRIVLEIDMAIPCSDSFGCSFANRNPFENSSWNKFSA